MNKILIKSNHAGAGMVQPQPPRLGRLIEESHPLQSSKIIQARAV